MDASLLLARMPEARSGHGRGGGAGEGIEPSSCLGSMGNTIIRRPRSRPDSTGVGNHQQMLHQCASQMVTLCALQPCPRGAWQTANHKQWRKLPARGVSSSKQASMADGTVPPIPPQSRQAAAFGRAISGDDKRSRQENRQGRRPARRATPARHPVRRNGMPHPESHRVVRWRDHAERAVRPPLGMLPGNVHRYLASLQFERFRQTGARQRRVRPRSGRARTRTRAMRRLDNQEVAFQETRALSKEIDASVWLSVWTENIPVVVAVHDRGAIGPLTARLGTRVRATLFGPGPGLPRSANRRSPTPCGRSSTTRTSRPAAKARSSTCPASRSSCRRFASAGA